MILNKSRVPFYLLRAMLLCAAPVYDLFAEEVPAASESKAARIASQTNDVMASVNDIQIFRKDVDAQVNKLLESQKIPAEKQAEARRFFEQRVISSKIIRLLVMKEAKKADIKITDEDRKRQLGRLESLLKSRNMTVDHYFKSSPLGEIDARNEFEEGLIIDKFLEEKILSASSDSEEKDPKDVGAVTPLKSEAKSGSSSEIDAAKEKRKRQKSQEAIKKYIQELKKGATITTPAYPNMTL